MCERRCKTLREDPSPILSLSPEVSTYFRISVPSLGKRELSFLGPILYSMATGVDFSKTYLREGSEDRG